MRLSRSFDGSRMDSDDWNQHRTFGGIQRFPRLTTPTPQQYEGFTSFCRQYESQHSRKPHVIAFVNSRSGGQTGGLLMHTLRESMGTQRDGGENCTGQVCDLSNPDEPENTIDALAESLDPRFPKKLLVCGGDGTVTWILTALEQNPKLKGKLHLLPLAILPLGTGNDLARSLGWGGRMRALGDIPEYLRMVIEATPVELDQWRVLLQPHEPLPHDHKLRQPGSHPQLVEKDDLRTQCQFDIQHALGRGAAPPSARDIYVGTWQNYFSLGLDAKVTWFVERARSERKCGRCCFRRGCGKLCYAWQGLLRSCCNNLLARSLHGVRLLPAGAETEEMEDLDPPFEELYADCARGRLRQLMMVNINSYGAGLDVQPPGSTAEMPPQPADGVLEVLGVRNATFTIGLHARLKRPSYIKSVQAIAFRLSEGEYMQLDGEPWHLSSGCDVLVEKHRKVSMLRAPATARYWRGHINVGFWDQPSRQPAFRGQSSARTVP